MNIEDVNVAELDHPIPMALWGKDHWSTLAYIETTCVDSTDGIGRPSHAKIQTNKDRHPEKRNPYDGAGYGIRLKGDVEMPGYNYDEWDIIEDCEYHGMLENIGSSTNPAYKMLPLGNMIVGQLRTHKTKGGDYATFDPTKAGVLKDYAE